jgi:hypothetical protein
MKDMRKFASGRSKIDLSLANVAILLVQITPLIAFAYFIYEFVSLISLLGLLAVFCLLLSNKLISYPLTLAFSVAILLTLFVAKRLQARMWPRCVPSLRLRAFMSSIMRWRSGLIVPMVIGNRPG